MTYRVICRDSDPQWKAERWDGLTASVLPGLLGLVPWEKRSQAEMLRDYAGRMEVEQTASMWHGSVMEAHIMECAKERYGWTAWKKSGELVAREGDEWFKATLDAETFAPTHLSGRYAECKWHRFAKAGTPPEYITAQVQGQLWITGEPWMYLVRCAAGEWPSVSIVEYDCKTAGALVAEARKLWATIREMRGENASV